MSMMPFVSVVMPIRNEARYISGSLGSVLAQDYPSDRMEVIVVDGMSDDNTRVFVQQLAERAKAQGGSSVTLLDNPSRIVPPAMNIGIRHSRGDVIVRVDGHTILEHDYVRQCVLKLQQSNADNVGGLMRAIGDNYLAKAIAVATSTPFGIGNSSFHYANAEKVVDTVYMGAFRRDTLFRVGLFNEAMVRHQDYELNYRIRKHGGTILLSPSIRSHYYVRNSLRKLWKQYYQYGCWKGILLRNHPDSLRWRHAIPPLFVMSLLASVLLTVALPLAWWCLALIIGSYLGFLAIATLVTSKATHILYVPVLPIIFAALHLSYGLGIWRGLLSNKTLERRVQEPAST